MSWKCVSVCELVLVRYVLESVARYRLVFSVEVREASADRLTQSNLMIRMYSICKIKTGRQTFLLVMT